MADRRKSGKHSRHAARGWGIIFRDLLLFGVTLNVFALFHHVLPRKLSPVDPSVYASQIPSTAFPALPDPSSSPETAPTPTPVIGDFSASFPAEDTGSGALYSYQTDSVRIAIKRVQENDVTYFVADVYVRSIDALKTAFAKGEYGKSIYEFPLKTAQAGRRHTKRYALPRCAFRRRLRALSRRRDENV